VTEKALGVPFGFGRQETTLIKTEKNAPERKGRKKNFPSTGSSKGVTRYAVLETWTQKVVTGLKGEEDFER